ncbi:MAG: 3-hydroxyacyl-CoA dehydrogenase NAD-binding domain-containing protein [bacterium]
MKADQIETVSVFGGGNIGNGIVHSFAQAGISVRVIDVDKRRLDACLSQVDANLRLFREFGLLDEDPSSVTARIAPVLAKDLPKAMKDCHFVVEAIPENLELKKQLFAQLDSCPEDVILASNTSSFPITDIAEGCRTAGRVIGLHYFNPAHIMPLVEIHYGPQTTLETIDSTKAFMLRVGKRPILVRKSIPGFVVNRIQAAIGREIDYLVSTGVVSPEDVDIATKASYGFRYANIGPYEFIDTAGLDLLFLVSSRLYGELSNATQPSAMWAEKVKRNELGMKTRHGWYDWSGKSALEFMDGQNRRLLKQLALFESFEQGTNT